MIYFLLEKVIRCAHMPVDCLRVSKLVTMKHIVTHISQLFLLSY